MYKAGDFLDLVLTRGLSQSEYYRKPFVPYLKLIEQYVQDNDLIFSNPNYLVDPSLTLNSYNFTIFTDEPFKHVKEITNKLNELYNSINQMTPEVPAISFQNKLFNYEMNISIESLLNVKVMNNLYITGKDTSTNTPLKDLLYVTSIVKKSPIFLEDKNIKLNYFAPEIELIDIYKKLYSPDNVDDWSTFYSMSQRLYNIIKRDFSKISDNSGNSNDSTMTSDARFKTFENVDEESDKILEKIKSDNYCMKSNEISRFILDNLRNTNNLLLLEDPNNIDCNKLQVITDNENFSDFIKNIVRSKYPKEKIIFVDHYPRVPNDFRLKKVGCYFMTDNKRKIFMEYINSAEYSLVPYSHIINGIKIAHPFVQLRFKYIDLWTLSMLRLPHDRMKALKLSVYRQIELFIESLDESDLYPDVTKYVGYYSSEDIEKKKIHIESIIEYKKTIGEL